MKLSAQALERDRELYDPAIDWLLNSSATELGETGTLAGTVGSLERGCQASGVPNTDLYSNYQMGWCVGDSPAEKWRKISPVWFRLGRDQQTILLAHYQPRNDLPEAQRVAVDGELGKLANAALWVLEGDALAKLLRVCMDKGAQGRRGPIQAAAKRAEDAVRGAHRMWQAIREMAPEGTPVVPGSILPKTAVRSWDAEYDRLRRLKEQEPELRAAIAFAAVLRASGRRYGRSPVETTSASCADPPENSSDERSAA